MMGIQIVILWSDLLIWLLVALVFVIAAASFRRTTLLARL